MYDEDDDDDDDDDKHSSTANYKGVRNNTNFGKNYCNTKEAGYNM